MKMQSIYICLTLVVSAGIYGFMKKTLYKVIF